MDIIKKFRALLEGYAEAKARFLSQGAGEERVNSALDLYKEFKLKKWLNPDENDIDRIKTWADFLKLLDIVEQRPRRIRTHRYNVPGAKLVFDDQNWTVYKITKMTASQILGVGTEWCIANSDPAKNKWWRYAGQNAIYFAFSKTLSSKDPNYKVAVLSDYLWGNKYPHLEIWDARNRIVNAGNAFPGYDLFRDLPNFPSVEVFARPDLGNPADFIVYLERKIRDEHGFHVDMYLEVVGPDGNQTVNSQDPNVDIKLRSTDLPNPPRIPVKFGRVEGYFSIDRCDLESLAGCPEYVGGSFTCRGNNLKNLVGGPKIVRNVYDCSYNRLESLEGGPISVGSIFSVIGNDLTDLHGLSKNIPPKNVMFLRNPGNFTLEDIEKAQKES